MAAAAAAAAADEVEDGLALDSVLATELLTMVLSLLGSCCMLRASACSRRMHAAASLLEALQLPTLRDPMGLASASCLLGRFPLLRELRLHGACLAFGPSCRVVAKTLPQLTLLEMRGNEITGTGAALLAAQLEAAPPTGAGQPVLRRSPLALRHTLTLRRTLTLRHPLALRHPLTLRRTLTRRAAAARARALGRGAVLHQARGAAGRGARRRAAPRARSRRPRAAPRATQPGG